MKPAPATASPADLDLVARLRAGDEDAFVELVNRHQGPMLRLARMYMSSRAVAEEVVQEAWLGVLQGLDRFEGRSSLRTWMYRIVVNIAKTRGQREGRSVPFASLAGADEPSVSPDRFLPTDDPELPGHWSTIPSSWEGIPEDRLASAETLGVIEEAIEAMPGSQATVIRLRDVQGWTSPEVCNALEISETNQRVLLHRARARVRAALEEYLDDEGG